MVHFNFIVALNKETEVDTETRGTGSTVGAIFILLAAMALYLLFDLIAAVSLNIVISGGFALVALALGLYIFEPLPVRKKLLLGGLLFMAVFSLRFVDWDSRKQFLRDFYQVQPGMTIDEVDEVMTGYDKYISPFVSRTSQGTVQTGAVSYQHTMEGWGDSDIGLITFAGGRVLARTYYPD
jgi:hypothetical protein